MGAHRITEAVNAHMKAEQRRRRPLLDMLASGRGRRSLRGVRGIALTLAALTLAIARAANAGPLDIGPAPTGVVDAARLKSQAAWTTVASLERELDAEFAARGRAVTAAGNARPTDEVLSQAKGFYDRLMSEPVRVEGPKAGGDMPPLGGGQASFAKASKATASFAKASTAKAPALWMGGGDGSEASTAPAAGVSALLDLALNYRGAPYRWGGASRDGLDCSGLVVRAARDLGRRLPHSAAQLFELGEPVAPGDLQPGDLVFFANTYKPGISHVGIYEAGSRFLQASSRAQKVTVGDLNRAYYRQKYAGARRLSLGGSILATARRWIASAGMALTAPFRLGAPG